MKKLGPVTKLILLVITLAALIAFVISHNRRTNAIRKAERIAAVGELYVIGGQVYFIDGSNQDANGVGTVSSRVPNGVWRYYSK